MKISRKYIAIIGWSVIMYVFVTFLAMIYKVENQMEVFFLFHRGGILLSQRPQVELTMLLRIALPVVIYIYLVSKFMVEDFGVSAVYVFTRHVSVWKWYIKQVAGLFVGAFLYTFMGMLVTCILGVLSGYLIMDASQFINIFIEILFLHTFVLFFYALLVNVLIFRINPIISYGISYTILIFSLLGPMIFEGKIRNIVIIILPTSQYMLNLREGSVVQRVLEEVTVVKGFSVSYSCWYLLSMIVIVGIMGYRKIKRMDIINLDW